MTNIDQSRVDFLKQTKKKQRNEENMTKNTSKKITKYSQSFSSQYITHINTIHNRQDTNSLKLKQKVNEKINMRKR